MDRNARIALVLVLLFVGYLVASYPTDARLQAAVHRLEATVANGGQRIANAWQRIQE